MSSKATITLSYLAAHATCTKSTLEAKMTQVLCSLLLLLLLLLHYMKLTATAVGQEKSVILSYIL